MKLLNTLIVIFAIALPGHEQLPLKNGSQILQKCIEKYDPQGKWPNLSLKAHIQEPRPSVPQRYSIVTINHRTGYFQMQRNREDKIATYTLDADGKSSVLIDGQADFPEAWREKYRLKSDAPVLYKRSYHTFYGLPMSLNDNMIEEIVAVAKVKFNNRAAYRIHISLREALFSKHWQLFIDRKDFTLLGIEMPIEKEGKATGERLLFEGTVSIDGITIPRMKHWYDLETGGYSGTDILLKLIE